MTAQGADRSCRYWRSTHSLNGEIEIEEGIQRRRAAQQTGSQGGTLPRVYQGVGVQPAVYPRGQVAFLPAFLKTDRDSSGDRRHALLDLLSEDFVDTR